VGSFAAVELVYNSACVYGSGSSEGMCTHRSLLMLRLAVCRYVAAVPMRMAMVVSECD